MLLALFNGCLYLTPFRFFLPQVRNLLFELQFREHCIGLIPSKKQAKSATCFSSLSNTFICIENFMFACYVQTTIRGF